jgi:hypothetical protein
MTVISVVAMAEPMQRSGPPLKGRNCAVRVCDGVARPSTAHQYLRSSKAIFGTSTGGRELFVNSRIAWDGLNPIRGVRHHDHTRDVAKERP